MIWKLGYDGKFQSLIWSDERDDEIRFDGTLRQETWGSHFIQVMPGNVFQKKGDFLNLDYNLVVSEHVIPIIDEMINGAVELLPVIWRSRFDEKFYVVNVTEIIDCLNPEETIFSRIPTGKIMGVDHYEFEQSALVGKNIFKIKEFHDAPLIFVSDEFRKKVESSKLRGLNFYPLP